MSKDFEITMSKLEEQKFDKISHENRLIIFPSDYTNPEKERINKFIDKIVNEKQPKTAWDILWWIITHPERDLKIVYYFINIIGIFMSENIKHWLTSIPAIISGILGIIVAFGLVLPGNLGEILTGGIIALICLFTDWKKFKENYKLFVTAILTLIFNILAWTSVIILPPATVLMITNFLVAIIGMLLPDANKVNVIPYTNNAPKKKAA